ncbi:hypothetical protein CXG81DRAFT_23264 [Caulochytrium protostelioides]|uniref:PQ-loop-domain-containing protein n=1 Tax=Caulochytrium protostelioides TaxID=1555241 RepID=A0A4P9XF40_9FUNG|nr:hypothetical protein CXG81DRAFT_23264 [Caulochytrium protostelioides]|eukprot:RKP04158.1 hypothetical protein CXG81DRAFT_23264 [Caulochytrium protostelioides]
MGISPHAAHVGSEVCSYFSLVLWSFQLLPQAYSLWQQKRQGAFSVAMTAIWIFWVPFFGSTSFALDLPIALLIQPQIFALCGFLCIGLAWHYEPRYGLTTRARNVAAICVLIALTGGLEYALYVACRRGPPAVTQAFGYLSVVILVGGFVPQYVAVIRARSTYGLARSFLVVDMAGGMFAVATLALATAATAKPIDPAAMVNYALVMLCDAVLLLLTFIWPHDAPPGVSNRDGTAHSDDAATARSTDILDLEAADDAKKYEDRSGRWNGPDVDKCASQATLMVASVEAEEQV